MAMKIGPHKLANPVVAAPMAGVSDKPYRTVCRQHGAGLVVSEMITSQANLRDSKKTQLRMDLSGEPQPISVQIVGTAPDIMADAALFNVANGAQIIDINMGCPAKKVCKKSAGSALLANEPLVAEILQATVAAVNVPVTLKIRTGTSPQERNAITIAKIAEDAGIQALTIHGRTRECRFVGAVEYDTIAAVKEVVQIPIIANGDIDSPQMAKRVLSHTGADAIMIGRAALGRPWLFNEVAHYLETGEQKGRCDNDERINTIANHLQELHNFYGPVMGVRIARKHIKWYLQHWQETADDTLRADINQAETPELQRQLVLNFLNSLEAGLAA